jgi:hypothetical protein
MNYLANKELPPSEQHARPHMRRAHAYGLGGVFAGAVSFLSLAVSIESVDVSLKDNNLTPTVAAQSYTSVGILAGVLFAGLGLAGAVSSHNYRERAEAHRNNEKDYGIVGNAKESIHREFTELVKRGLISKKNAKIVRLETLEVLSSLNQQLLTAAKNSNNNQGLRAVELEIQSLPEAIKFVPSEL